MTYKFTTVITQEDRWYVARCFELGVVSQGRTIEKAQENLKEAVKLYLEDYPKSKKRFFGKAPLITSFELTHA